MFWTHLDSLNQMKYDKLYEDLYVPFSSVLIHHPVNLSSKWELNKGIIYRNMLKVFLDEIRQFKLIAHDESFWCLYSAEIALTASYNSLF